MTINMMSHLEVQNLAIVQSQAMPFMCAHATSCTFPFEYMHIFIEIEYTEDQSVHSYLYIIKTSYSFSTTCTVLSSLVSPPLVVLLQPYYSHVHSCT